MLADTTRLDDATYLRHLNADSHRLVEVLAQTDPRAAVPTCPGWTADDLLAHVLDTQSRWRQVVADAVTTPQGADAIAPTPRPTSRDELLDAVRTETDRLAQALAAAPAHEPRWAWSAPRTVGFVTRRSAHDACLHRLDAELTAAPDGTLRSPIDDALAADGVDEALRVLRGRRPTWATLRPEAGRTVRVVATDTGSTWLVTLAQLLGTDERGEQRADPAIFVAGDDPVDGTVRPVGILSATAEDLYCRLWHRPVMSEPHRAGDLPLVAEIEGVLALPLPALR